MLVISEGYSSYLIFPIELHITLLLFSWNYSTLIFSDHMQSGNILLDSKGAVKLGDFGVSACMFDGDRQRSRNTFVGTPCW